MGATLNQITPKFFKEDNKVKKKRMKADQCYQGRIQEFRLGVGGVGHAQSKFAKANILM